jgi:hypothetical protein
MWAPTVIGGVMPSGPWENPAPTAGNEAGRHQAAHPGGRARWRGSRGSQQRPTPGRGPWRRGGSRQGPAEPRRGQTRPPGARAEERPAWVGRAEERPAWVERRRGQS